jgi:hypothetical protein
VYAIPNPSTAARTAKSVSLTMTRPSSAIRRDLPPRSNGHSKTDPAARRYLTQLWPARWLHLEAQAPEGMPLLTLEVIQTARNLLDRRPKPVEQA